MFEFFCSNRSAAVRVSTTVTPTVTVTAGITPTDTNTTTTTTVVLLVSALQLFSSVLLTHTDATITAVTC